MPTESALAFRTCRRCGLLMSEALLSKLCGTLSNRTPAVV